MNEQEMVPVRTKRSDGKEKGKEEREKKKTQQGRLGKYGNEW